MVQKERKLIVSNIILVLKMFAILVVSVPLKITNFKCSGSFRPQLTCLRAYQEQKSTMRELNEQKSMKGKQCQCPFNVCTNMLLGTACKDACLLCGMLKINNLLYTNNNLCIPWQKVENKQVFGNSLQDSSSMGDSLAQ